MNWFFSHLMNILFGMLIAVLGYFTPVKDIVHVMCAAIFIDFATGLWASRTKGNGITSFKMWRTIYKLFLSTLIVMLLFSMDKEMGVMHIEMHRLVAWLITGFEIWSILENAAVISDHRIFKLLKKYMHDKIEKQTGIDINENK